MIDAKAREEVLADHIYLLPPWKSEYTIKKVFEDTKEHGQFHYHMSNCGHQFLATWDKEMIWDEPTYYRGVPHSHYVFAAVFVHYWSKALFEEVPEWVHRYKHPEPYPQNDMPLEIWEN